MGVPGEAVEETLEVLVQQGVNADLIGERSSCPLVGKSPWISR
jgi:hypothetical protein